MLRDLRAQGLSANGAFADEILVQDFVAGPTARRRRCFAAAELLGFHGYRQIAAGAGGGEAIKQSESRADVRAHVAAIGATSGLARRVVGRLCAGR